MKLLNEKIKLVKIVIEFLMDESWQQPTYEDILQKLYSYKDEECLPRHALFVCDQILSIDQAAEDGDTPLLTSPCIRSLVKMAGVTFAKRKWKTKLAKSMPRGVKKSPQWSKATTKNIVQEVMESFFTDQIANNNVER